MEETITFESVKISGGGYLADGMSIPKEDSNRHYQALKKWIDDGGVVDDEFDIDQIRNQKTLDIKGEASRRIVTEYSIVRQRNILMSQEAAEISTMNDAIANIRDKSNLLEELLNDMTIDQLNDFDASQEENWN